MLTTKPLAFSKPDPDRPRKHFMKAELRSVVPPAKSRGLQAAAPLAKVRTEANTSRGLRLIGSALIVRRNDTRIPPP